MPHYDSPASPADTPVQTGDYVSIHWDDLTIEGTSVNRPQVPAKVTSVSTEGFTAEMLFFQPPSSLVPRDFDYLFDDPDWERLEIGEMSERQRLKYLFDELKRFAVLVNQQLAPTNLDRIVSGKLETRGGLVELQLCCARQGRNGICARPVRFTAGGVERTAATLGKVQEYLDELAAAEPSGEGSRKAMGLSYYGFAEDASAIAELLRDRGGPHHAALREACRAAGLRVGGKAAELAARLKEASKPGRLRHAPDRLKATADPRPLPRADQRRQPRGEALEADSRPISQRKRPRSAALGADQLAREPRASPRLAAGHGEDSAVAAPPLSAPRSGHASSAHRLLSRPRGRAPAGKGGTNAPRTSTAFADITSETIVAQRRLVAQARLTLEADLRMLERSPPVYRPPSKDVFADSFDYAGEQATSFRQHVEEAKRFLEDLEAAREQANKSRSSANAAQAVLDQLQQAKAHQDQRQAKEEEARTTFATLAAANAKGDYSGAHSAAVAYAALAEEVKNLKDNEYAAKERILARAV
ncbi:hypothetical protein EMIHUDRAFT_246226 [Emiliania huxleyi CCMP1516]|uniref:Uncharacterized protein n=2 Tax=Emiliania huxleyi TaxID=2903 RepID=A0A0D3IUS4_EMIH1|nr:hypothetical protein EMIHUDRAFT_246226 [Emiliania huxleyi CCMP1516]EOD15009.1 hypothetical protein EMIHUDRAFT_246226 [Emiliania huxleyi CCMP1516]|eukprot:XP_005767438.1 hypothetical protein EMIHUDRAFT_246226 [Emiliania huxleyi CCMP1516]